MALHISCLCYTPLSSHPCSSTIDFDSAIRQFAGCHLLYAQSHMALGHNDCARDRNRCYHHLWPAKNIFNPGWQLPELNIVARCPCCTEPLISVIPPPLNLVNLLYDDGRLHVGVEIAMVKDLLGWLCRIIDRLYGISTSGNKRRAITNR